MGWNWANQQTPNFGRIAGDPVSGHRLYAFLRHNRKARSTVLIVCNFDTSSEASTYVHIPQHACEWAGKKSGIYTFTNLLNPDIPPVKVDSDELVRSGLPIVVPPGDALLLEWS